VYFIGDDYDDYDDEVISAACRCNLQSCRTYASSCRISHWHR